MLCKYYLSHACHTLKGMWVPISAAWRANPPAIPFWMSCTTLCSLVAHLTNRLAQLGQTNRHKQLQTHLCRAQRRRQRDSVCCRVWQCWTQQGYLLLPNSKSVLSTWSFQNELWMYSPDIYFPFWKQLKISKAWRNNVFMISEVKSDLSREGWQ